MPRVLVALVALTVVLAACAHEGGQGHRGHFRQGGAGDADANSGPREGLELKRFDLDGDGKVTKQELDGALQVEFAKCDVDHDAKLNVAETRTANEAISHLADGSSPVLDWNADGFVDFKEYATQWVALFERLDADHDGVVTQAEMAGPHGMPHHGAGSSGRHNRPQ